MIRPDVTKWEQTLANLRLLSLNAEHQRTRERFQALYMIATGQTNATSWAEEIGRSDETILKWVHTYNQKGPSGLVINGRVGAPFFSQKQAEQIAETVRTSEPVTHGIPGHGWTLKKLRRWVKETLKCEVSANVLRSILQAAGLSWKKCQTVLKKANPAKRAAYIEQFQTLYEQVCRGEVILVYLDESHFHRDMDLGYTWAPVGKPAWRLSDSASLSDRINWYGAYDFSNGQCLIWNEGSCNAENTAKFLAQLSQWLGGVSRPVVIVWDGAPWHRSQDVQQAAANLGFTLLPLPGYSPDLNPIEEVWKWMREDVTKNYCHNTMRELFDACKAFIDGINTEPERLISRLWPKFELDPEYEKLLVSN